MNLGKLFSFGQKAREMERTTELSPLLSLGTAENFMKDAGACLNDRDGSEFVNGMRAAFLPLQGRVLNEIGKETEYGDTLQEFAKLTRDNPEPNLEALMLLASRMKHAPACGVRFVIAELILAYGSVGVYPNGSIGELLRLKEESLEILEAGSKYG